MGAARRRKGGGKGAAASTEGAPSAAGAPSRAGGGPRSVVWDLLLITSVIGGPYALYSGYLWLHLESGWLRPAVGEGDMRQLLVVGTQSSGTVQMTASLKALGLEFEHEHSDTQSSFSRDGTVSWLHGLRYFPGRAPEDSVTVICARSWRNLGFHPAMFRRAPNCSYRVQWGDCWKRECAHVVRATWGCARTEAGCVTPYARALLQARHPLRTIESLTVKFCRVEAGGANPMFSAFVRALFPTEMVPIKPCVGAVAWYWTLYSEHMADALEAGALGGAYHVEATGACEVARLGGFANASYPPSRDAFARACGEPAADGSGRAAVSLDTEARRNRRNTGLVSVTLEDLRHINAGLADRLRTVAHRLGYTDV